MDQIITYAIVAAAFLSIFIKLFRKIRNLKSGSGKCASCQGCSLKEMYQAKAKKKF